MRTAIALRAAADSNTGRQRDVNEDRVHADASRGLFMVIDGVGGHAAGGKAADIALTMLRTRLERETGSVVDRVREAIAIANNEIHRAAGLRPEWNGMACVLTVVVMDEARASVGHVGDTRLYKLREDRIDKITRDHSPVGEREDSNEISELEAMRHPRRNEVYRDVGSDPHEPDDPDFIDIHEIAFEPDAALLLCSDGLTDLIDSSAIHHIVSRCAGQPDQVVARLITAANAAGGKDNISVVYVEGEQFAAHVKKQEPRKPAPERRTTKGRQGVTLALIALLAVVIAMAAVRVSPYAPIFQRRANAPPAVQEATIVVGPTESIAAALQRAGRGSVVRVEPGEYREAVTLKNDVRVVSRVARGATIRLSGTASEGDVAVVATGVTGAELVGFRIVGDAATPLGTGVLVRGSDVSIVDIEVTGAVNAAIAIDGASSARVLASDVHDNPGAALAVGAASARIAHNVFMRNGRSERVRGSFMLDEGADTRFSGNVFHGVSSDAFRDLSDSVRTALSRDNWFPEAQDRGHRGR